MFHKVYKSYVYFIKRYNTHISAIPLQIPHRQARMESRPAIQEGGIHSNLYPNPLLIYYNPSPKKLCDLNVRGS